MKESRRGARVPADGTTNKQATVEVGVEIGLMVNIETTHKDGKFDMTDVKTKVVDKINDLFEIDNRDKVLTNVSLYAIQ